MWICLLKIKLPVSDQICSISMEICWEFKSFNNYIIDLHMDSHCVWFFCYDTISIIWLIKVYYSSPFILVALLHLLCDWDFGTVKFKLLWHGWGILWRIITYLSDSLSLLLHNFSFLVLVFFSFLSLNDLFDVSPFVDVVLISFFFCFCLLSCSASFVGGMEL